MKTIIKYKKLILYFCIIFIILMLTRIGCIFRFLTGIPCPACGMTRAYLSLFRLDFKSAFYYHPLFILLPPLILLVLYGDEPNSRIKSKFSLIMLIFLAIFIFTWIYRLFFVKNSPIGIDFSTSFVLKLVYKLFRG